MCIFSHSLKHEHQIVDRVRNVNIIKHLLITQVTLIS